MRTAALRQAIALALIVFGVVTGLAAAQAKDENKTDVTGAWAFEVQTPMGTGTPTVTFKQDGETLTGHYSSAVLGEIDFTGTVKGNAIAFSFKAEVQGTTLTPTYAGTVDGNETMKGTVKFGDMGEGTFSGKRK
jgi:hypothetical protein